MNNIYSTFYNNIPPSLGPNPGEPSWECPISKEPLNLGISIFAPVSSVPGSSSFFFLQPLLTGKVFASIGILITAQIIMFIADRFFGHELPPVQRGSGISSEQTVQMSLSDLQDFLASLPRDIQPSTSTSAPSTDQSGTTETQEIPLVFALTFWGDFTNQPYGPTVFFILPLFTFPGVRGALPILILELLATIFVRAVVPPQTTGSKPLSDPTLNRKFPPLQFSPEDLLNLLNRFSKHFGT